jgi:hypothetical protein
MYHCKLCKRAPVLAPAVPLLHCLVEPIIECMPAAAAAAAALRMLSDVQIRVQVRAASLHS